MIMDGTCELCKREDQRLTRHHLIPRTRHRNKRNKREFSREDVHSRILMICRDCHNQIHAVISEKELERSYNTAEKLLEHPEIVKFVTWIQRRKPRGRIPVRRKKS